MVRSRLQAATAAPRILVSLVALIALAAISNPAPAEPSNCSDRGRPPSGTTIELPDLVFSVVLDGNRAYVVRSNWFFTGWGTWWGSMLSIYDISASEPQVPLGTLHVFADSPMAVDGGFAYLANGWEFHVVDVSDPTSPHTVGTLSWPRKLDSVAVEGKWALVGDAAGLHVLDVADPTSPSWVGSVTLSAEAVSVALNGSFAYVGTLDSRLTVVDVSDPLSPTLVGSVVLPGIPKDIEIRGFHGYLAAGNSGLQVLDLSRPALPRLVGGADMAGDANRVAVGGARAYVAASPGEFGLRVVDISNPARPKIVNSIIEGVTDVSVDKGRVAVGGRVFHHFDDCIAQFPGHCDYFTGYLKIMSASTYDPTTLCARLQVGAAAPLVAATSDAPRQSSPMEFALRGNNPNPFNPQTSIRFDVPRASQVRIQIYDALGRLVKTLVDSELSPGGHAVSWEGRNVEGEAVASGIYFVVLEAEGVRQRRKIALLK